MSASTKSAGMEASMSAMDAIYHRRAVRDYAPEKIDEAVIRKLLDATVHAPTAIHEEPVELCDYSGEGPAAPLIRPERFGSAAIPRHRRSI